MDKFSLYTKLHQDSVLPRYGVTTIGQRKRLVLLDTMQGTYQTLLYHDILTRLQDPNDELLSDAHFFVDDCYGEDFSELQEHPQAVAFSYKNDLVFCLRNNKTTNISDAFVSVSKLEAFYLS